MKNILFTIGLLALSLNISTQDQEYTNAVAITSKNSITGKMENHYVHTGNTKAILPVYRFLRVDRLTETVLSCRYRTFKPTFAPDSPECNPLPDKEAVEGYGCVLTYEYK